MVNKILPFTVVWEFHQYSRTNQQLINVAAFTAWVNIIFSLKLFYVGDLAMDVEENHLHCVDNVKTFTECFLFSLETQHTIG